VGIFSKFKDFQKNRSESRHTKAVATLKNAKAIKEDRWAAIDFFSSMDDVEIAVPALLQRFEYSLEHGINDTREKEACMEGITQHGDKVLPLVKEHLKSTTRIAWPIKIIRKLGSPESVVDCLKDALNYGEVAFDRSQVDKNYDILCHLIEYKLPGEATKLAHFLKDQDERVRYASAEVLIEQDDSVVPEILEPFLVDLSPDNSRIRQAVLTAFVTKKWKISDPKRYPDGRVAEGVTISKQGTVEARV